MTCVAVPSGAFALPEPALVAEIRSPGNEPTTQAYASIPSVREILIIHLVRMLMEQLLRGDDGTWPDEPVSSDAATTLTIRTIGLTCPISALYRRNHLSAD